MKGKRAPRPRNEAQIATLKDFKGRGMRLGRDIWTEMPLSEKELAVGED